MTDNILKWRDGILQDKLIIDIAFKEPIDEKDAFIILENIVDESSKGSKYKFEEMEFSKENKTIGSDVYFDIVVSESDSYDYVFHNREIKNRYDIKEEMKKIVSELNKDNIENIEWCYIASNELN